MDYLSRNIKYLRLKNKMTQEEFGKIVGKTRTLICAWESNDRDITTEDIIKIADHFNIKMDSLISEDLSVDKSSPKDELQILFDKNKNILTDSDIQMIKFIVEQRKKEIDKSMEIE